MGHIQTEMRCKYNPQAILVHHVACLLVISVQMMEILLSVCLCRNLPLTTGAQSICLAAFDLSWILLRLIMLPVLLMLFHAEYVRYSALWGDYDIAGCGLIGTAFVTV